MIEQTASVGVDGVAFGVVPHGSGRNLVALRGNRRFRFSAAMSDAGIAVAASATNAFKNFIDNLFPIVNGTLV